MYWNIHDVIWQSRIQGIGDCKRILCFSRGVSRINVFFSGIGRCYLIEWGRWKYHWSMLCFFQNFQLTVLFLNRNKMGKKSFSYMSPSFHATCSVASDLWCREFGSRGEYYINKSPSLEGSRIWVNSSRIYSIRSHLSCRICSMRFLYHHGYMSCYSVRNLYPSDRVRRGMWRHAHTYMCSDFAWATLIGFSWCGKQTISCELDTRLVHYRELRNVKRTVIFTQITRTTYFITILVLIVVQMHF